jgi:hypothetical protein
MRDDRLAAMLARRLPERQGGAIAVLLVHKNVMG